MFPKKFRTKAVPKSATEQTVFEVQSRFETDNDVDFQLFWTGDQSQVGALICGGLNVPFLGPRLASCKSGISKSELGFSTKFWPPKEKLMIQI